MGSKFGTPQTLRTSDLQHSLQMASRRTAMRHDPSRRDSFRTPHGLRAGWEENDHGIS